MAKSDKHGLYDKFTISHKDGKVIDADTDSKYFVLRYDTDASDKVMLKAARQALLEFCDLIKDSHPELSSELKADIVNEVISEHLGYRYQI